MSLAVRPSAGASCEPLPSQLDIPWARTWPAVVTRENFGRFILRPMMDVYAARRATGREKLAGLKGPVILVANHASHMDTPVILAALPWRLRKRTAVAAAADYFYKNRLVAAAVSLVFNTVPIERRGGVAGQERQRAPRQAARPGLEPAPVPRRARARATAGRGACAAAPRCWPPPTTCRSSPSA